MKRLWKLTGIGLALLVCKPWVALGQAPGAAVVPAVPVAAAPVAAAPAAPVAAAPQRNLWSFLCLTPEQKARCKARFCASQFGQLINNSLAPASALTGGVIPQCCPGPVGDPANLLRPPTSALGAAARVQADTAAAAARREAVRYLSTVDCNYWPEARAALINSLRADRNECVRLEAALALQRGCCCNKDTIKALVLTVSGGRDDDNPAEDSPRVRAAAMAALDHCLCCYVSITPVPPLPPEAPPGPRPEGPPATPPPTVPVLPPGEVPAVPVPVVPVPAVPVPVQPVPPPPPPPGVDPPLRAASYYERVQSLSIQQVVLEARQVLQRAKASQAAATAAATATAAANGIHERSLGAVFDNAFHPPTPPVKPAPPQRLAGNLVPSQPPFLRPVPANPPPPLASNVRLAPSTLPPLAFATISMAPPMPPTAPATNPSPAPTGTISFSQPPSGPRPGATDADVRK